MITRYTIRDVQRAIIPRMKHDTPTMNSWSVKASSVFYPGFSKYDMLVSQFVGGAQAAVSIPVDKALSLDKLTFDESGEFCFC